jgi:hypothetical protein
MRSIIATLAFLSFVAFSAAQDDDVFSNKTNMALEKVIRDFPNRFRNIKGDLLVTRVKTTEYKSTVQVPGFPSCLVVHYASSPNADAYSWNCTAVETKEFSLAKIRFKEIYDQIQNTIIKIDGEKPFIVSGQYRTPNEERKYCDVGFELLPAVGEMKKLKMDLILQYVMQEWKVLIVVYDSDKKEDEVAATAN